MATTPKGIYYNTNYSEVADVLADEKAMAESIDETLDNSEKGLKEQLANKVDKVAGKGLSTNDFTNEEKEKLADLHNYDDTDLSGRVSTAEGDIGEIKEEQSAQNTSIQNNTEAIEALQAKNAELEEEIRDLEDNQIPGQATGTEIYISDSAKAKNRSIGLTGRSTQESTTGANLMKFETRTNTINGATYKCDEKGQVTISGTTHYDISLGYNLATSYLSLTAGTYKLKVIGKFAGVAFQYKETATGTNKNVNLDNNQEATIEITTDITEFQIIQWLTNATTYNCDYYITLAKGTTATTERYTGGEASPNPSYPQEIKNTGDSGSINERIVNKNILNSKTIYTGVSYNEPVNSTKTLTKTKPSFVSIDDNGVIKFSSPSYEWANFVLVSDKLPIGNYKFKIALEKGSPTLTGGTTVYLCEKTGTNKFKLLNMLWVNQSATTVITPTNLSVSVNDKNRYLLISFANNAVVTNGYVNLSCQLEPGSTATDYVPHEEQTYSIPTQQPMRSSKDNTVRDGFAKVDGVWNEVHPIEEIVLDGTEGWRTQATNASGEYRFATSKYASIIRKAANNDEVALVLCNKFIPNTPNNNYKRNNSITVSTSGDIMIYYDLTKTYTAEQFETWLSENNLIVQFIRLTPTYLPCTEEQVQALEQIQKARTYKGGTHISSEDETPANVDIEYVVDTKTYIDNKFNELSSAIVAQGGV